mmetsp:Transcript_13362/g.31809  ORF Transcript_13362/g.31809 Transcript_13362/m.31809 type:complete len:235 (+) Transcript_13362:817-1521(+)
MLSPPAATRGGGSRAGFGGARGAGQGDRGAEPAPSHEGKCFGHPREDAAGADEEDGRVPNARHREHGEAVCRYPGGVAAADSRPEGGHRSQGQRRRFAPRAAALREPRGSLQRAGGRDPVNRTRQQSCAGGGGRAASPIGSRPAEGRHLAGAPIRHCEATLGLGRREAAAQAAGRGASAASCPAGAGDGSLSGRGRCPQGGEAAIGGGARRRHHRSRPGAPRLAGARGRAAGHH